MKDLIFALQLLQRYGNPSSPTHCEHDELRVMIDPEDVSDEDKKMLAILGFVPDDDIGGCFISHKYGSA